MCTRSIDEWVFVDECVQACASIGVYISVILCGGSCIGEGM